MQKILNALKLGLLGVIVITIIVLGKVSLTDMTWILPTVVGMVIGASAYYFKHKKVDDMMGAFAIASGTLFWSIFFISNTYFFTEDEIMVAAKPSSEKIKLHTKPKETRVITKKMALRLAKQTIAKKVDGVNISTQFKLDGDNASIQIVNGELIWVIPLDYQGVVKYLNQEFIPGYVEVSAIDGGTVAKLISDKKIRLSKAGFFQHSIEMRAWKEANYGVYSYHFEIDDKGTPFWIVSAKKALNVGGCVRVVDYVTVINAETLESKKVSPENVKKEFPWIDKIIDDSQAENIIDGYTSLKEGWWNQIPVFGPKENISKPTNYNGKELWFVQIDGRGYYMSGLSSVTSEDNSLIGIVFQDTITGETYINENVSGMDESAAIKAVEGALGNDAVKWKVVLPQLVHYNNKWYWSTTVVSSSGFFQKVGVVEIDNSKNVFFGKSVKLALEKASYFTNGYENDSKEQEMISIPKVELMKLQEQLREMQDTLNVLLSE